MKSGPDQHRRIERKAEHALHKGKAFLALRLYMEAGIRDKVREVVDMISVEVRKQIIVKHDKTRLLIGALLSLGHTARLDELADCYWDNGYPATSVAMCHAAENDEALKQRGQLLLQWNKLSVARDAFVYCCSIQNQRGEETLLDDPDFHIQLEGEMSVRSHDILEGDPAEFHERQLSDVMAIYEFLSSQHACEALITIGNTCMEKEQPVWAVDAYSRAVTVAGGKTKDIVIADALLMKFAELFREYGNHSAYHTACTLCDAMGDLEDAGVRHLEAGRLKKAVDTFLATLPRTGQLKSKTRNAIQRTVHRLQFLEHDMLKVGRLAKAKYFSDLKEKLEEILEIFPG